MSSDHGDAPSSDDSVKRTVAIIQQGFDSGVTRPVRWRRSQLRAMRRLLTEQREALCAALHADLGKSAGETYISELAVVSAEVERTLRNLSRWLRPRRVSVPLSLLPGRARTILEPRGMVLIIGAWNYPLQLVLVPLVGALAAGNSAVVKPSELAPRTSELLARLLPQYLDTRAVAVVEGGVVETTCLLGERFDHIFYTGGERVGRIVMEAASRHLTPVTLELGGKSPVFVHDTADLEVTARRIVWAKFLNAGQTCVAPDYILATSTTADLLERLLTEAVQDFFGSDPAQSPDYSRIVNEEQLRRLRHLLEGQRIVTGGQFDATRRYFAPTILADVAPNAPIMQQEIFGPILPVLRVHDTDEAISFITGRPKPLALYVFSRDREVRARFEQKTSSGAIGHNIALAHIAVPELPFGGVGASGFGQYHGRASIETFSHRKSVLSSPSRPDLLRWIYPPSPPPSTLRRRLANRIAGAPSSSTLLKSVIRRMRSTVSTHDAVPQHVDTMESTSNALSEYRHVRSPVAANSDAEPRIADTNRPRERSE